MSPVYIVNNKDLSTMTAKAYVFIFIFVFLVTLPDSLLLKRLPEENKEYFILFYICLLNNFHNLQVLVGLFHYLGVSDLLSVSQVSRLWREAASYLLADRVTIMITDDVNPAVDTFLASSIPYHNWVFKVGGKIVIVIT